MKTVTIPVVITALGMIKKGTEKYLEQIPGDPTLLKCKKQSNNEQLKQCWMYIYWTKID